MEDPRKSTKIIKHLLSNLLSNRKIYEDLVRFTNIYQQIHLFKSTSSSCSFTTTINLNQDSQLLSCQDNTALQLFATALYFWSPVMRACPR